VGGGFHRYSTDAIWLVPHFEKMLYDNALMLRLYAQAYKITGNEELRRKGTHLAEYLLREMFNGNFFYASQDADTSEGEGAYYAPELTKVFERRGEGYIKAALMSKTPWSPRGRKMVAYAMSDQDATDVAAFFKWIGEVDLNGFPPTPDLKK
jgi:uncharacterized protein YyaL (SSP411 family)